MGNLAPMQTRYYSLLLGSQRDAAGLALGVAIAVLVILAALLLT